MITTFEQIGLTALIALVMFGMGASIKREDMVQAWRSRRVIFVGLFVQFGVMPFAAFLTARLWQLPDPVALGLVMIGCSPGGATSNLFSYYLRADVSLSILMTSASTVFAFIVMPLTLLVFAGPFTSATLQIPYTNLVTALIGVLLTVALGVITRVWNQRIGAWSERIGASIGGILILALLGSYVVNHWDVLRNIPGSYAIASFSLACVALGFGLMAGKLSRLSGRIQRTIAIEAATHNLPIVMVMVHLSFPVSQHQDLLLLPSLYASTVILILGVASVAAHLARQVANEEVQHTSSPRENRVEQGQGFAFDPAYTEECYENNLRFISEEYFRARLINGDSFPLREVGKRAIILVPNHSGMGLSWDNIILDFLIYDLLKQEYGLAKTAIHQKVVRLVDPLLITHKAVTPFGIEGWWTRIGCVPANFANFEQAVKQNRIICVSPEGVAGISKGFHRRYQLQRYSSSFLALAQRYGAIVIPISVVNAEYVRPYNYCNSLLNRIGRKIGLPFLPLGLGATQIIFPATYLTPLPAQLTYVLHEPITYSAGDAPRDRAALRSNAEEFQVKQQAELLEAVRLHHRPFGLAELWKKFRRSKQRRMFVPFFWHEMFLRTAGAPSGFSWLYKIPFGYPLIWLGKHLLWMPRVSRGVRQAGRGVSQVN